MNDFTFPFHIEFISLVLSCKLIPSLPPGPYRPEPSLPGVNNCCRSNVLCSLSFLSSFTICRFPSIFVILPMITSYVICSCGVLSFLSFRWADEAPKPFASSDSLLQGSTPMGQKGSGSGSGSSCSYQPLSSSLFCASSLSSSMPIVITAFNNSSDAVIFPISYSEFAFLSASFDLFLNTSIFFFNVSF
jgi:hypothetical protein